MEKKIAATQPARSFDALKRDYESAVATGNNDGTALMNLSAAIVRAVVKKCMDPQRKTAPSRNAVSDNGYSPALDALRRGTARDVAALDNLRTAADKATRTALNADGEMETTVNDKEAENAVAMFVNDALSDGVDLVQTAALSILEQTAERAVPGETWLDTPYTVRRLSRRVYIRLDDSAAYKDVETSPVREAFAAVRRAVMDARAVKADNSGYTYVSMDDENADSIFFRCGKYADMGGTDSNGLYSADMETVTEYAALVARLDLTDRQAQILRLRERGYGYDAIATYLGVTQRAIAKTVGKLRDKARAAGIVPGWEKSEK